MTLGAGLVLSGCGDDDTATTPAPAPPPPPPPAPEPEPEPEPPQAPATPTGFHVDTTQTSLTWHWNAVEGAIGYAVQVSTDEMFDDTDTISPTAETSFTVADLPPQTTLYARVAAAAGTLEAPVLSAWTTHVTGTTDMPPPPPPPPMAPATPTGLMAEEGEGSITWMWDAVEGADGYAVQVSMDEMFDDMDETTYTMETMHTVSDLGYGETRFARVASTSGEGEDMLMSMFTTHVTGMSMAEPPPPPPPAPDPVMVTFSLSEDADSPHFLVADDDDDEATAMASVNEEIMVNSNADAIITPMFVEGANGVSVMAGDNMPFGRVSWSLMQSAVLSDGATFMVQRAVIGANQMEDSGDVAYVTCGPFECADGMDAPELRIGNSAVCTAWDPMVEIQVGKVDNDVVDLATPTSAETKGNDGIDLGIVTSSSIEMTVTHIFSGVAKGANSETKTTAEKGSNKALTMKAIGDAIRVDGDDAFTPDTTETEYVACDNSYDAGSITDRPKGCFRLIGPGTLGRDSKTNAPNGADYLSGYSLKLTPSGAGVTWGRVEWEEDPFEDLTCSSTTIMVADEVDICDMFEDEVDYAIGTDGWSPEVVFAPNATVATNYEAVMWRASAQRSGKNTGGGDAGDQPVATKGKYFKTLWFDDDLDGKISNKNSRRPTVDGTPGGTASATRHDLYNQNAGSDNANIEMIWEHLTDRDGDLTAGDLGKADLLSDEDVLKTEDDETTLLVEACPDNTKWDPDDADDTTPCKSTDDGTTSDTDHAQGTAKATHPDGKADNYPAGTAAFSDFRECSEDDGGDDDDGSICDAEWVRDAEVLFADGTFGCTTTRMVTITCEWDADGGMAQGRNALPDSFVGAGANSNKGFFLKCEAE